MANLAKKPQGWTPEIDRFAKQGSGRLDTRGYSKDLQQYITDYRKANSPGWGGWMNRTVVNPTQGMGRAAWRGLFKKAPAKLSLSDVVQQPQQAAQTSDVAAPPDYASQYANALNQSRAGIEGQFRAALGDIAAREKAVQPVLQGLPGQLSQIYGSGDAATQQATTALDQAQAASGTPSFMSAGAQIAPVAAARATDLASRQASVPLINLAVQQQFANQRAALNQERLGQLAGIDNANTDRLARLQELDYRNKLANDSAIVRAAAVPETPNKDTGLTPTQEADIRNSKEYKQALSDLADTTVTSKGFLGIGKGKKTKVADLAMLYKKYEASPQLLKVLGKDNPRYGAEIARQLAGG